MEKYFFVVENFTLSVTPIKREPELERKINQALTPIVSLFVHNSYNFNSCNSHTHTHTHTDARRFTLKWMSEIEIIKISTIEYLLNVFINCLVLPTLDEIKSKTITAREGERE